MLRENAGTARLGRTTRSRVMPLETPEAHNIGNIPMPTSAASGQSARLLAASSTISGMQNAVGNVIKFRPLRAQATAFGMPQAFCYLNSVSSGPTSQTSAIAVLTVISLLGLFT